MHSAGQASAEYAAILALVAAALLAMGTLVGLEGVAQAVVGGLRTGICIVGGDVCRGSDAEAAGLAPCTVDERTSGGGATLTIVALRLGGSAQWTVAKRSDGSVIVTRTEGRSAGVSVGIGITASPLGLKLGAKGSYDFTVGSGSTWELPDVAAARRLLEADDRPQPTWRFGDLGAELTGKAGVTLGGATLTGVESAAQAAAGARIGKDATTLYFRARLDGPSQSAWAPGGGASRAGPSTGDVLVELTREHGALREIAFRTAERGGREGEVVETVARLDLRDPSNRAAVAPLLAVRLPWPPSVLADLRSVIRRTAQTGVVERAVYAVSDDSNELEVAARLGVELGLKADRIGVHRRLVAASAWTAGSDERERVDCVGAA